MLTLPCQHCGAWFAARRASRLYCGTACRKAAEYRRRRCRELEQQAGALTERLRRDAAAGQPVGGLKRRLLRLHIEIEQLREPPAPDLPDDPPY
ncbi:MAG: hypothetical protein ACODAC_11000 [Pseudomonadota bacterium]